MKLAQALLTLLPWLWGIIHTCLQKIADQKMQTEYSLLIEQVCGIVGKMSDNKISCSLLYIARLEDAGNKKMLNIYSWIFFYQFAHYH